MKAILLDTHAWVWALMDANRLSISARNAIESASRVFVSPISLFEISQKVRVGKWPEMAGHLDKLIADGQTLPAPFTHAVAATAGMLDWNHRDPFDRLIGATALEMGFPLISIDTAFDALSHRADWPGRIW